MLKRWVCALLQGVPCWECATFGPTFRDPFFQVELGQFGSLTYLFGFDTPGIGAQKHAFNKSGCIHVYIFQRALRGDVLSQRGVSPWFHRFTSEDRIGDL